jgi:hypothetical protein
MQGQECPATQRGTRARDRVQEMGLGLAAAREPARGAEHPAEALEAVQALVAQGAGLRGLAQGAGQAVERPAAKVPTLARNQAQESSNEVQARLEAEGRAVAVLAVWAQAAPAAMARAAHADQATREAACQVGARKTKTSWEF